VAANSACATAICLQGHRCCQAKVRAVRAGATFLETLVFPLKERLNPKLVGACTRTMLGMKVSRDTRDLCVYLIVSQDPRCMLLLAPHHSCDVHKVRGHQHERAQERITACLPFAFKIASSTWCAACMKSLHLGSSAPPFSEVPASPPSFESFASSCCATLPRNPMTLSVAAAPTASSSGGGVAPPEAMFLPTTPAET